MSEVEHDFCPFCGESFTSRKHPSLIRAWEEFDELVGLRDEVKLLRQEIADVRADKSTMASKGGQAAAAKMTPQERSERATKAANARWHGRP